MLFEYFQFALVFSLTQMCIFALVSYVMLKIIFSERGMKWYARKVTRMTKAITNIIFEIEDEESK